MSDEVVVELNKVKIGFIFVFCVAMTAFCLEVISLGESFVFKAVAYLAALIPFLTSVLLLKKLLDNSPGLVITNDMIVNNSTLGPKQTILWSDVKEVKEFNGKHPSMLIIPFQPELFMGNGNLFHRALNRYRVKILGTSVGVSASTLKISHQKLLYHLISNSRANV